MTKHLVLNFQYANIRDMTAQHLQYHSYSEPYIIQCLSVHNKGFTFTGKERDEVTGYSYFGARYYDADLLTSWISVDPMADKYPSLSPYNYCAWNPVKFVDVNGGDFAKIVDNNKRTITISAQFISLSNNIDEQKALSKAILAWNLCSFSLTLKDSEGIDVQYTVLFNINKGDGPINLVSFFSDEYFDKKYNNTHPNAGAISDGQQIDVRSPLAIENNQILAHEMGHCLGLKDTDFKEESLMFSSNTGNIPTKKLSSFDQLHLLAACGFDIKKISGRAELCVYSEYLGEIEMPMCFGNTQLTDKNLTNNNTNYFVK